MLDFLPQLVRQNPNLTIQVLVDMMTVESAMVKSLFRGVETTTSKKRGGGCAPAASTTTADNSSSSNGNDDDPASSFIKNLPENVPRPSKFTQDELKDVTPFEFLQLVLEAAGRCCGNNNNLPETTTIEKS